MQGKHGAAMLACLVALALWLGCGGGDLRSQRLSSDAVPLLEVAGAELPVRLRQARVETMVVGGVAQTTVELEFHNPNRRVLEGQLAFPLRDGQRITGFALDIDGRMRAAVPVEKAKGRQVFEAIARQGVDPALLEQTAGNHFRLRIFPIPAAGSRRVRLVYSETLAREGDHYRLPVSLAFARGAAELNWDMRIEGVAGAPRVSGTLAGTLSGRMGPHGWDARFTRRDFSGQGSLELRIPRAKGPRSHVQRIDDQLYFLAELPVEDAPVARTPPKAVMLLWDSSGSARGRDHEAELAVLDRYLRTAGDIEVSLVRLRDVAEPAVRYPVRQGDWSSLREELRATIYDGASRLGAWRPQAGIDEYLLVSDGVDNYGPSAEFPELQPGQRLFALSGAGPHADGRRLRDWAEARGGRAILFDASGVEAAARDLLSEQVRLQAIEMEGGEEWIAPSATPQDGLLRVAGRLTVPVAELRVSYRAPDGRLRRIPIPVDGTQAALSGPVGQLWAGYWVDRWSRDSAANAGRIQSLGQRFGLVTGETSLMVLETVEDYVEHEIAPPVELRAAYEQAWASRVRDRERSQRERLDEVAVAFEERREWWNRDWPKGRPPAPPKLERRRGEADRVTDGYAAADAAAAPVAAAPSPPPAPASVTQSMPEGNLALARERSTLDSVAVTGAAESVQVTLQPWQPDSPYARRLRAAPADRIYALYLDERDEHAASTAFYLDVADILFEKGQRGLALRVLSNLAELDLENRHILRVLAYRLMQAREPALALEQFRRVRGMAEEEPQSFRDLGLAQAEAGDPQAAIESLYEVVRRDWDARFDGVKMIALTELNAIVANAGKPLDTHAIDPRLLDNLPLDLRAVLTWDSDNSDMDLWVTDPNGEKCFYSHPETYQGGRLSDDFTGGYGPEEFALRVAKPGKYRVEANFFGDRQSLVTGATTLQLAFITRFGTPREQRQIVTLRLKEAKETVLVGEFEVR